MTLGKFSKYLVLILPLAVAVLLTFFVSEEIDGAPITRDGLENLTAAYNLANSGTMGLRVVRSSTSQSQAPSVAPDNFREPLPILFWAAVVASNPKIRSLPPESLALGEPAFRIKIFNVLWVFALLVGIYAVIATSLRREYSTSIASIFAIYICYKLFLQDQSVVNSMYTELHAATLLTWSTFALILGLRSFKKTWIFVAGLLFGLLTLTKAIVLYTFVGLMILLLVRACFRDQLANRTSKIVCVGIFALAFAVAISPWVVRNIVQLKTPSITQRGGVVLLARSNFNDMTWLEALGAIYYWAPGPVRPFFGDILGFTESDVTDDKGKLRRLARFVPYDMVAVRAGAPDKALGFEGKATAKRKHLRTAYKKAGDPNWANRADRDLMSEALDAIMQRPLKHVAVTPLIMWRGAWAVRTTNIEQKWLVGAFSIFGFILIWLFAIVGAFRLNPTMLAIGAPTAGLWTLLALTSHFLPRYASMTIPQMAIALCIAIAWLVQVRIDRRFKIAA